MRLERLSIDDDKLDDDNFLIFLVYIQFVINVFWSLTVFCSYQHVAVQAIVNVTQLR